MAKTTTNKKFTHMVGSVYTNNSETNEFAYLFTSLESATKFVQEQFDPNDPDGDTNETYFIAEIISSSKIARSIVTENFKK